MLILVTRPEPQASEWVSALQAQGEQAAPLPLIDIGEPADVMPVQDAWRALHRTALVMFVSPNAVQWFARLRPSGTDWPAATLAASPGPGTAQALAATLADSGLTATQILSPDATSDQFDSEHLWPLLAERAWAGRQVLVVSGGDETQPQGRQWLSEQLRQAGAVVTPVLTYQRRRPAWSASQQKMAQAAYAQPTRHVWLFSSSQAVHHLVSLQGPTPPGLCAMATHPRVADTARQQGFSRVQITRPLPDAVAQARRSLQSSVDTMNLP